MSDEQQQDQGIEPEKQAQAATDKVEGMVAYKSAAPRPPVNFGTGANALSVFAGTDAFAQAQRQAVCLASGSMIPEPYQAWIQQKDGSWKENPNAVGNCMIALEMANRLGETVLAIMQNMDVVKGRPGFRGKFVAALVNKSPLFSRMKYRFSGEPGSNDYGCQAYATEVETGEVLEGTKITWKMVVAEGWSKNDKWTNMREQMFMYRAASFWVNAFAPELLLGVPSLDELEDIGAAEPLLVRNVGSLNERLNGPVLDPLSIERTVQLDAISGHDAVRAAVADATTAAAQAAGEAAQTAGDLRQVDENTAVLPKASAARAGRKKPTTVTAPLEQAEAPADAPAAAAAAAPAPAPAKEDAAPVADGDADLFNVE